MHSSCPSSLHASAAAVVDLQRKKRFVTARAKEHACNQVARLLIMLLQLSQFVCNTDTL